ncbi:MAG: response regulator transcription factor, partial [Chloroflexota bacterium]
MNNQPTVVVADNQSIAIRGLRALAKQNPIFEIIGEASDGLQAVDVTLDLQPDILVLDLEMPGLVGFEVAKRVLATLPEMIIIIYSGHGAYPYIRKALNECGAMAYVHKDDPETCIFDAVERVLQGKRYLSPTALNAPEGDNQELDYYLDLYERLTDTEKELLYPLAEGHTATQIADARVVEESTVRTHIEHIKTKLSDGSKRLSLRELRQIARLCT